MTETTETTQCLHPQRHDHLFGGVVLVLIGSLLLLDHAGSLGHWHVWHVWPLLLVLLGIAQLARNREARHRVWGYLLIGIGLFTLLGSLGIVHLIWHLVWPAGLVILGLYLITTTRRDRDRSRPAAAPKDGAPEGARPAPAGAAPLGKVILSSRCERILSREFAGGEISAVLGSYELDLTQAELKGGQADLWVNAVLGAVIIRVPERWKAEVKGAFVLGGSQNKTRGLVDADLSPRLTVHASCVLGSVEIRN